MVPLGLTAVALTRQARRSPPTRRPCRAWRSTRTWGSTQNVGWVRYAFDQFGTPYDLIFKDDVKKGGLRARYDVIIVPSQGRSAKDFVFDIPMRWKPLSYEKTARFKYLGDYGASPDIRGGMGLTGLEELRKFVADGGVLITLGDSSAVPAEFGLTPDVEVSRPSSAFYAPGPIVKAKITRPRQPDLLRLQRADACPCAGRRTALFSLPGPGPRRGADGVSRRAQERAERPDERRRTRSSTVRPSSTCRWAPGRW